MRVIRHIWKQAPAIALLLLMVGGWLAVPVSLLVPEPITCGMMCCEESGECCCFISRQEHQHEASQNNQDAQLLAWRKECPSPCATQPSHSLQLFTSKALPQVVWHIWADEADRLTHRTPRRHRFTLNRASAPRAPPLLS
jgi:hypothetical protein